ncbi:MAG: YbaB/EbfC family nucleoid-associated protein [Bacteroidota bacterium]
MFGDMMNQMNEMQEKMKQQLAAQSFTAEAGDGAIQVSCNGARQLTNISINTDQLDLSDSEELEDLLLVAVNRVLEEAATYEAEQAGGMMKDMLPGGLGGLFG